MEKNKNKSTKNSKKNTDEKKATTYRSAKFITVETPQKFAEKFKEEVIKLRIHTINMISQYRKIKNVRNEVADPANKSIALRIDWSENGKIYQTRQEKSAFYGDGEIQVSINTAVLYQPEQAPRSLATISDDKCHQAQAVWASLESMLKNVDFAEVRQFYIISDSPSNQYRNKFYFHLAEKFAQEKKVKLVWIFTETGHGKGPMDGVGAAIKAAIDEAVAFNPDQVIKCTADLMNILPARQVNTNLLQEVSLL